MGLLAVSLTLCSVLSGLAGPTGDAKSDDPSGTVGSLQDMVDAATATKAQFSAFTDRVNANVDKLQHDFQKERTEIADLKLERQSVKAEQESQRVKLGRELEEFKHRTLGKLADLQADNKRLEETNTQLVATNTKLATDLESERSKKEVLVKKLKKMAALFNHQSSVVEQMIHQQQTRVADEVSVDMKDALDLAGASSSDSTPEAKELPTIPVAPPVEKAPAPVDSIEAAMTLPGDASLATTPSTATPAWMLASAPAPGRLSPIATPAVSLPRATPVAATHVAAPRGPRRLRVLNTPRPPPTLARAPAAAAGVTEQVVAPPAVQVPPPVFPAPTISSHRGHAAAVVQPASANADDEQLKSLRAEVENLESSVNDEDGAEDAAGVLGSQARNKDPLAELQEAAKDDKDLA